MLHNLQQIWDLALREQKYLFTIKEEIIISSVHYGLDFVLL